MKQPDGSLIYAQPARLSFSWQGENIPYASHPGSVNSAAVSPAIRLLAEQVNSLPSGDGLMIGCGVGVLPVIAARHLAGNTLWGLDHSWIACNLTRQTLELNQVSNFHLPYTISVLPDKAGSFRTVMITLPKGRKLAQRWLLEAYQALETGGVCYLAGANDQGIQPVIRDAASLFGNSTLLAYKKGHRVAYFKKLSQVQTLPEWTKQPGIIPGSWHPLSVETSQGRLELYSMPGIFSYDRMDEGTQLLVDTWHPEAGKCVLDLGCGYGILGILAAKAGARQVYLVDENLLAIAATQHNIQQHHLDQAQVMASDGLNQLQGRAFDEIVTNPPFHRGAAVDYEITRSFIQQSWQALNPNGQFWLVANRFIPYEKIMEQYFRKVNRLAETPRYYVLRALK